MFINKKDAPVNLVEIEEKEAGKKYTKLKEGETFAAYDNVHIIDNIYAIVSPGNKLLKMTTSKYCIVLRKK